MNTFGIAALFMPIEAVLPLLVLAGLLIIVGLRRMAGAIISLVLLLAFSPMLEPVFEGLFSVLPIWAAPLLLVAAVFSLFGKAMRQIAVHVAGDLISSLVKTLLLTPAGLALLIISAVSIWILVL